MSSPSLGTLTASKLRLILCAVLVLILVAQVGLVALGQNAIRSYAEEVASAVAQSSSNEKTVRDLESVRAALDKNKATVEKSKQLIADKSNTYAYQNQIIQDITRYANLAGLQVTGFAFSEGTPASGASSAGSSSATKPASGVKIPAGVTPVAVTVTLSQTASYDAYFRFLQLLEGNLLRTEITGINLNRPTDTANVDANTISLSTINLQVYKQK